MVTTWQVFIMWRKMLKILLAFRRIVVRKRLIFAAVSIFSSYVLLLKLKESLREDHGCEVPHLIPNDSEVMKRLWNTPPIKCPEINVMEINAHTVSIRKSLRYLNNKTLKCKIREIIRMNDYLNTFGETVTLKESGTFLLRRSDFIEVMCFNKRYEWMNVMAGIRHSASTSDEFSWDKVPAGGLGLSVLIIAFDSVSRVHFGRKLPRSLEFLRKTLRVVEFEKYNVLGDGTIHATIPFLTGKTVEELPETRKRFANATFVDVYPLIWKEFRRSGYVTAFAEDESAVGMFTYRLKGFDAAPTHHYMRPFYLEAERLFGDEDKLCFGPVPRHRIMLDYTLRLFRVYRNKPVFMYTFRSEPSHAQYRLLGSTDNDFLRFLRTLHKEGHLERTLLIVMSDHGARFSSKGNIQDRFEERLPMFAMALPQWFSEKHPTLYRNLVNNTDKLTTAFDVHATLKEVLNVEKERAGGLKQRAISLFKSIPQQRSCADAQIKPHWCACLKRRELEVGSKIVMRVSLFAVATINRITSKKRFKCQEVSLHRVLEAAVLRVPGDMLRFHESRAADDRVPIWKKALYKDVLYQIKFSVLPSDGLFEASVIHHVAGDTLTVENHAISRLNAYAPYVNCLNDGEEDLQKYCFCRLQKKKRRRKLCIYSKSNKNIHPC